MWEAEAAEKWEEAGVGVAQAPSKAPAEAMVRFVLAIVFDVMRDWYVGTPAVGGVQLRHHELRVGEPWCESHHVGPEPGQPVEGLVVWAALEETVNTRSAHGQHTVSTQPVQGLVVRAALEETRDSQQPMSGDGINFVCLSTRAPHTGPQYV